MKVSISTKRKKRTLVGMRYLIKFLNNLTDPLKNRIKYYLLQDNLSSLLVMMVSGFV